MSKDEKKGLSSKAEGPLDKFEPGGESGPIEDRNEYEQRLGSLPPDQREVAQESSRFADLCQYFSQQRIDLPPDLLEQVGRLSRARNFGAHSRLEEHQSRTDGVPE